MKESGEADEIQDATSLWGERLAAVGTLVFAAYMGYRAQSFPVGGHLFPSFVMALMAVIAGVMLVNTFLKSRDYDRGLDINVTLDDFKPVIFTGIAVLYFLAIFRLGYFASTLLLLLVAPLLLGLRRPVFTVMSAILTVAFIYGVFEMALVARLPKGILF